MGNIISEGLEHIGRIDDNGYVFDTAGTCIAKINESGYISKLADNGYIGIIDPDGTIRDSMSNAVGNIQANGYVYINGTRICHADSDYIKSITPDAWDYGHAGVKPNAKKEHTSVLKSNIAWSWPFGFGTTLKLIVGVVLGIYCIVAGASSLGFLGCLMAIPFCIAVVFIFCFIIKCINGG